MSWWCHCMQTIQTWLGLHALLLMCSSVFISMHKIRYMLWCCCHVHRNGMLMYYYRKEVMCTSSACNSHIPRLGRRIRASYVAWELGYAHNQVEVWCKPFAFSCRDNMCLVSPNDKELSPLMAGRSANIIQIPTTFWLPSGVENTSLSRTLHKPVVFRYRTMTLIDFIKVLKLLRLPFNNNKCANTS